MRAQGQGLPHVALLVSHQQLEKVMYYVNLATQEGGTIHCGGKQPLPVNDRCAKGFFFEPTVITGLDTQCRVNQEEIFGPVVTIMPFTSEDQVVDFANSTPYGLCASLWTNNISRAHRLSERLGAVLVNYGDAGIPNANDYCQFRQLFGLDLEFHPGPAPADAGQRLIAAGRQNEVTGVATKTPIYALDRKRVG